MYSRNVSFQNDSEKDKSIPENYSGYTMSMRNQPNDVAEETKSTEELQNELYSKDVPSDENSQPTFNYTSGGGCTPHKESGLFSGLLEKIGIKGAESSDITLLIVALLLISGENDDYIWILLLLLLLIK